MIARRYVIVIMISALVGLASALPVAANDHGKHSVDFIRSLADKVITSLTDQDTVRSVRIERFRKMFRETFAIRSIGKRAFGRYWRKATADERVTYQKLFEDLMVITYVDRFAVYAGEALEIIKSRIENKAIATVFSEIRRKGSAKPIRVDWIVGTNGTIYKIVDVKVEGVSMTQTLASDFSSIIRRRDGKVAALLEELQKKTAELSAITN